MRGPDVVTAVVPPATEPLQAGDAYVVRVGRWLRIRCRVLESSAPEAAAASNEAARVFAATGTALGGLLRARFRRTVFRQPGGPVMARAQARLDALPFLVPSRETLANEHRHTLRDLNLSFRAGGGALRARVQ